MKSNRNSYLDSLVGLPKKYKYALGVLIEASYDSSRNVLIDADDELFRLALPIIDSEHPIFQQFMLTMPNSVIDGAILFYSNLPDDDDNKFYITEVLLNRNITKTQVVDILEKFVDIDYTDYYLPEVLPEHSLTLAKYLTKIGSYGWIRGSFSHQFSHSFILLALVQLKLDAEGKSVVERIYEELSKPKTNDEFTGTAYDGFLYQIYLYGLLDKFEVKDVNNVIIGDQYFSIK